MYSIVLGNNTGLVLIRKLPQQKPTASDLASDWPSPESVKVIQRRLLEALTSRVRAIIHPYKPSILLSYSLNPSSSLLFFPPSFFHRFQFTTPPLLYSLSNQTPFAFLNLLNFFFSNPQLQQIYSIKMTGGKSGGKASGGKTSQS